MMSYRFARRSFLGSIGGAFGLEILLRNMEAGAQGAGPPPRFLMMHWPSGTIQTQFVPTGSGTTYSTSKAPEGSMSATNAGAGYIISPFDTPELRPQTIILYGFNMSGISSGSGGGHESGTPMATTGASCPGTRDNQGEDDDGCAGGPSWDQILLKNVPALAKRNPDGTIVGRGYYNSICDSRIDSYETSTRCLSYSHETQSIASARPGGMITEHKPLEPTLSPLTAYNDLFSGFTPGGMTDEAALRLLKHRRSVLDYSRRELARLRTLGPSSEWGKIDAHAEVIRKMEDDLSSRIMGGMTGTGGMAPPIPDATLMGKSGSKFDYNNPEVSKSDETIHEQVGQVHSGIIRAAFQCDIIRVATFQWSPGTNHVSFAGLDPNEPAAVYMHHPLSHKVQTGGFFNVARPNGNANVYVWDAMVAANHWYFQKTADIINQFRTAPDPLDPNGGFLLDRTVIPMITEVAEANHGRNGHGAIIFGGKALGMQGGQFKSVNGIHNQVWLTVAQAYLGASPQTALADETYIKNGANPIAGLWQAPA